jgi:hypothetical protein
VPVSVSVARNLRSPARFAKHSYLTPNVVPPGAYDYRCDDHRVEQPCFVGS